MTNTPSVVLGFDYGTKRIGIAVGQSITGTATPLGTVRVINNRPEWEPITEFIESWQPNALVIGIPYTNNGKEHSMVKAAEKFGRQLEERYKLKVHRVDEHLSSAEAEQMTAIGTHKKNSDQNLDMVAAKLILQTWFLEQQGEQV